MKSKNPHVGSSFDSWLKEQGIYELVVQEPKLRLPAWIRESSAEDKVGMALVLCVFIVGVGGLVLDIIQKFGG